MSQQLIPLLPGEPLSFITVLRFKSCTDCLRHVSCWGLHSLTLFPHDAFRARVLKYLLHVMSGLVAQIFQRGLHCCRPESASGADGQIPNIDAATWGSNCREVDLT